MHVNPTSEMSQMEYSRCILNRFVVRFIVEKFSVRYESIGRLFGPIQGVQDCTCECLRA